MFLFILFTSLIDLIQLLSNFITKKIGTNFFILVTQLVKFSVYVWFEHKLPFNRQLKMSIAKYSHSLRHSFSHQLYVRFFSFQNTCQSYHRDHTICKKSEDSGDLNQLILSYNLKIVIFLG